MKEMIFSVVIMVAFIATATGARDNFLLQQAQAEMQRVSGQIDVLQNNFEDLQGRVGKIERAGDLSGIRQEIDSLRNSISELRSQMARQREEIVKDLASRMAKIQAVQTKPAAPAVVYSGPHFEYKIEPGDTLSLIAATFETTVAKIKEMNGMKSDILRVGQVIKVPKKGN